MFDISLFLNNLKTKPLLKVILWAFVFLLALLLICFLIFWGQRSAGPITPPAPSFPILPAIIIPSDQKVAQVEVYPV